MVGRNWFQLAIVGLVLWGCGAGENKKVTTSTEAVAQRPVGNPETGKVLFTTCETCHGHAAQGNKLLNAPALAQVDGWYLYRQLMNFRRGIRGDNPGDTLGYQMAAFAKTLKDSVAVSHLVAYIQTLPGVALPAIIDGDLKKGERAYQGVCGSCHGPGARGNEKMNAPRLNALDDWYLKRQLYNFKHSIRGAHPADIYGGQMVPMAALLIDDQAVNDVIAYIRSTTQPQKE